MIRRLSTLALTATLVAQAPSGLKLGDPSPTFSLPGTDGKAHGPQGKTPLLVVFLSTECPYVMATQGRINAYARQFSGKVQVLGINANDVDSHAKESLKDMQVQSSGQGFVFPYLKDEPQLVTKAFGALCTPDFFLFDGARRLVYHGRLDDGWKDASKVTTRDLEKATEALLAGKPLPSDQPSSRGCSIKWK